MCLPKSETFHKTLTLNESISNERIHLSKKKICVLMQADTFQVKITKSVAINFETDFQLLVRKKKKYLKKEERISISEN